MYKRILIPFDGSPLAEQALPHAIAQARYSQAELILLKVVEPFPHARGLSLGDLKRIEQQASTWSASPTMFDSRVFRFRQSSLTGGLT